VTAKEVSLAMAAAPFGGCASASERTVGSGRRLKCGRWKAVQLVCLELVVCRRSRVRARVESSLLHSTSSNRYRWPSLLEPALVEVTQVNAVVALDCSATTTIATLELKQSDLQLIPLPLTRCCIFLTSSTWAAAASRERLVAT
jgi:hypothetical protein